MSCPARKADRDALLHTRNTKTYPIGLSASWRRDLCRTRSPSLAAGVAGSSAAHELVQRGFAVSVYERKGDFGGKARARPASRGRGGTPRRESTAFRFFPGFYRHLPGAPRAAFRMARARWPAIWRNPPRILAARADVRPSNRALAAGSDRLGSRLARSFFGALAYRTTRFSISLIAAIADDQLPERRLAEYEKISCGTSSRRRARNLIRRRACWSPCVRKRAVPDRSVISCCNCSTAFCRRRVSTGC